MIVPRYDHHFAGIDESCAPVFVVGAPRSGTTLMRLLLNAHPELAMLSETFWGTRVWDRRWAFPMSLQLEPFRSRLLDTFIGLLADDRRGDFPLDFSEYRRRVEAGPQQLDRLLSVLGDVWAQSEGKPRWGEKTPQHAKHLGVLHRSFPRMKAVHIVHDPRDVVASMIGMPFVRTDDPLTCALAWLEVMGWMEALDSETSEAVLTIRYEQLVEDSSAVLRRVCTHVDLRYDDAMLEFSADAAQYTPPDWWHRQLETPIRSAAVGRWQRELAPDDVALIEEVCAPEMRHLGYELSSNPARLRGDASRMRAAHRAWLDERDRPFRDHVSMHRGEYYKLLTDLSEA